jgi:hypothetical protein
MTDVPYTYISSTDLVAYRGGVVWDMHFVYSYDTYIKLRVSPQTITLPNPLGFKSVQVTYNAEGAQCVRFNSCFGLR